MGYRAIGPKSRTVIGEETPKPPESVKDLTKQPAKKTPSWLLYGLGAAGAYVVVKAIGKFV